MRDWDSSDGFTTWKYPVFLFGRKTVKDKTSRKNKLLLNKNISLKYKEMIKQKKPFRANVVAVI